MTAKFTKAEKKECGNVGPSFPTIARIGKLLDTRIDYYLYNLSDYYSDQ